ncbi:MAG: MFS transporter [Candidatus Binatus sp.]
MPAPVQPEVIDTVPEYPASLHRAPVYSRTFWIVFSAQFALNMVMNSFVMFPVELARMGASATVIGIVVSIGWMAALLARPACGVAIDRYGRRSIALVFLLLDAAATLAYIPLQSVGLPMYSVRAIHGAVDGVARVALFAMVYDVLPEAGRGQAMATFSLCGQITAGIAPIAAEEVIRLSGFELFFMLAAVLCIVSALFVFFLPADHQVPATGGTPSLSASAPAYRSILTDHTLSPLWIVTLLFAFGISSRLSFITPFAYERGVARIGIYFLIYSVVAVSLRIFGARVIDRVGFSRMLLPSMLALAAGLALIARLGSPGMLELAALLGGIGHGYLYPALSALIIERTPINAIGRASSIYTSLYDFGYMTGPYLLGAIATGFGYPAMFIVSGAMLLAGAIFYLLFEPVLDNAGISA